MQVMLSAHNTKENAVEVSAILVAFQSEVAEQKPLELARAEW